MANLHIKKDESLKASLEAHDIIGSALRFSPQAGTMWHVRPHSHRRALLSNTAKKLPFQKRSPLLPPKDNSSTFSARHTKQNASAPDENNKCFQVGSISPTEQAAALRHFRAINLLSREEREPNFKTAYCVLPAWVAFRHWEEKTQLFQASVNKRERQTETERLDNTPTARIESAHIVARTEVVFFVNSQASQWTSGAEALLRSENRQEDWRERFGCCVGHGGEGWVLPREITRKHWHHCWYGCDLLPTM